MFDPEILEMESNLLSNLVVHLRLASSIVRALRYCFASNKRMSLRLLLATSSLFSEVQCGEVLGIPFLK